MVSLPDTLIVEGQQFIVLPLDNWHQPIRPVRLAGRYTCDTDDFYPRPGQPPLLLPAGGERMVIAFSGLVLISRCFRVAVVHITASLPNAPHHHRIAKTTP
jgi:hypothetical protein